MEYTHREPFRGSTCSMQLRLQQPNICRVAKKNPSKFRALKTNPLLLFFEWTTRSWTHMCVGIESCQLLTMYDDMKEDNAGFSCLLFFEPKYTQKSAVSVDSSSLEIV